MLNTIQNGYRITALISPGSMGSLYQAESANDASKKVLIHLIEKKYFLSPSVASQYQDWFGVLKQLRHNSLLTCLDYWKGSDHHGLVYEYFEGSSLQEVVNDRSLVWDKDQIDNLVGDVLSTLQYVSEKGHAHLQVNPRSILYNPNSGEVKVHSFFFNTTAWANYVSALPIELLTEEVLGIMAQDTGSPQAEQLELMNYMSPEQVEGLPLHAASDIYSAGVLLFRLVTQTLPYENFHSEAEYADRIRTLTVGDRLAEFQGLPENLTAAVMKATATESDQRFSSAREFEGKIRQLRSVEQIEMTNRVIGEEVVEAPLDERTAYSDMELEDFRRLIERKLSDARKELGYLQDLIARGSSTSAGGEEDQMESEQLAQMASRQITYIEHLEKALLRIENKTYGICRVTGKLIEKERLMAVPIATISQRAKDQIQETPEEKNQDNDTPAPDPVVQAPISKTTTGGKGKYVLWALGFVFAAIIAYVLFQPGAWSKAPIQRAMVSELALREDTGVNAFKIRDMNFGEEVRVINIPEIYPWVRVKTMDGVEGFMHGQMLADRSDFDVLNRVLSNDRISRHISQSYRRRSLMDFFKDPSMWNGDSTLKWQPVPFYYDGDEKYAHQKQGEQGYSYFRIRLRNISTMIEKDVLFIHRNLGNNQWNEEFRNAYDRNDYTDQSIESMLSQYPGLRNRSRDY